VYWKQKVCENIDLVRDDYTSFGPETLNLVPPMKPGVYEYWVNIFSPGAFQNSLTQVTIYYVDTLVNTTYAPQDPSTNDVWWHAFTMTFNADATYTIVFHYDTFASYPNAGTSGEDASVASSSSSIYSSILLLTVLVILVL